MSDVAIRVEHLSKQYRIGKKQERYYTLRDTIAEAFTAPLRWFGRNGAAADDSPDTIWALKDVSFEVKHGEVVGIIGRNGAGKSTLLKVLSRITEPTEGRVEIHGRVASLLEVGTGFHPELTGRENIYLNGAILGMSRKEIDRKFDEIVDFAEIEKFIDTPVKRYSSGMYVRLAFAVAAHLEPEILLVDEVLAVGDAAFQKKCLGKMGDVAKAGRTVLFVSHNMAAVEGLCSRAAWLDAGCLVESGGPRDVIARYLSSGLRPSAAQDLREHPGRTPKSYPVIRGISLLDEGGNPTALVAPGSTLTIRIDLEPPEPLAAPVIGIGVNNALGQRIFTVSNRYGRGKLGTIAGRCSVACTIPKIMLAPGLYSLKIAVGSAGRDIDTVNDALTFEVAPSDVFGTGGLPTAKQGVVLQESLWSELGLERASAWAR